MQNLGLIFAKCRADVKGIGFVLLRNDGGLSRHWRGHGVRSTCPPRFNSTQIHSPPSGTRLSLRYFFEYVKLNTQLGAAAMVTTAAPATATTQTLGSGVGAVS